LEEALPPPTKVGGFRAKLMKEETKAVVKIIEELGKQS
jgi:hypothetical protein